MYIDSNCNLWSNDGKGSIYTFEVCDPVEAPTYALSGVSVSNFVIPAMAAGDEAGSVRTYQAAHHPGDVGESSGPVPLGKRGQQRQSAMDRIVLAHREVRRQLGADRAELGSVSEPACADEHRLRRPWVDAEAAARIGDVGVHDFLVAAEPVIIGPGRLEWRIKKRQVQRLVEVECGFKQVDHRGTGQDYPINASAVIEQVLLHCEGPNAVREQDHREARMLSRDLRREEPDVVKQPAPSPRTQVP